VRILMVASEVAPFAKTGGLADVVGALPRALSRMGHDVRIVMPMYASVDRFRYRLLPLLRRVSMQWGTETINGELMRCAFPGPEDIPVYFIQQDFLFGRAGFYGEAGQDYEDNDRRFAFFCSAALWVLKALDWPPDVVHLHDWQAGLVAPLLRHHGAFANDPFYQRIRTVFTIHNLAYQGIVSRDLLPRLQLPWSLFTPEGIEFHQHASLLKAGIVCSDRVTTVSPTYAREIQTEEFGAGMNGVLQARSSVLHGILNGIDNTVWNPATDPLLAANYSADNLDGKKACKRALQQHFGLKADDKAPIVAVVSRLVDQKGFDLVSDIMARLLSRGAQFVLLGTGSKVYEEFFRELGEHNHGRVGVMIGYDEDLAHRIEAGADIFLMPSRFEPSGLNQLYSMHYGTVPIVRHVGGLADSVTDTTKKTLANNTATGFVFEDYTPEALWETIMRAIDLYEEKPDDWRRIQRNGMAHDFSWTRSAEKYDEVYKLARA
jgi:starch synthase